MMAESFWFLKFKIALFLVELHIKTKQSFYWSKLNCLSNSTQIMNLDYFVLCQWRILKNLLSCLCLHIWDVMVYKS